MTDSTHRDPTPPDFLNPAASGRVAAAARRWKLLAGGTVALGIAGLLLTGGNDGQGGHYLTEEAVTGNLVVSISASGTLQPTRSVDVGSELSGTLEAVLANENDRVNKGQIVARLDPAKLRDAVAKSKAAVEAAAATVAQIDATVAESRANLNRLKHVAELSGGKVPSKTELEAAEAAAQRALANLASARADVSQARATLKTDETNLEKAVIRSPINGVVLTRKVEPGQTVAAQMTTPVLYVIAMVLVAGVGGLGRGEPRTTTPQERAESAARLGNRLFLPALAIPLTALAGTFAFKRPELGGLVDPKQATLVSLILGVFVALAIALPMLRARPAAPLQEGRRLLDTVGWAAVLPQMLAALGAVFAAAGVGAAIGQIASDWLPDGSRLAAVAAYTFGMARG